VSGQNAAYITPTIWETDRTTEPGAFYKPSTRLKLQDLPSASDGNPVISVFLEKTASNEFLNSLFNGSRPATSLGTNQNALFQSGRQLFGNQALGTMNRTTGEDRPIGMTSNGNDYQFDPMVLPLTYEMADYISKNTFTDKGKGTIALRYTDDSKLAGDYTLYLKVQPASEPQIY
jgi:hypothetical protein